jgi:hypothetical protein
MNVALASSPALAIERSGMPQASKRVAGRSEHGAAVRRPPDPDPPSRAAP